jgi:hypothetical protein
MNEWLYTSTSSHALMALRLPYHYCGSLETAVYRMSNTDDLECDELWVAGCYSILELFQLMKTIVSGSPTVQKIKQEMRLPMQRTTHTLWHYNEESIFCVHGKYR